MDGVVKFQQHAPPPQHGLGLAPRAADEAWIAVQGVEQRSALESELLHPLQEGRDHVALPLGIAGRRSEEHTSELQSLAYLVCRLLLEKKKKKKYTEYLMLSHVI